MNQKETFEFSEYLKKKYLYGKSEEFSNIIYSVATCESFGVTAVIEHNYKKEAELIRKLLDKKIL